jgi:hypothetical protein
VNSPKTNGIGQSFSLELAELISKVVGTYSFPCGIIPSPVLVRTSLNLMLNSHVPSHGVCIDIPHHPNIYLALYTRRFPSRFTLLSWAVTPHSIDSHHSIQN